MNKLARLGVTPDSEVNNITGEFRKVYKDESMIDCFVVPTDVELMIAKDTYELVCIN